MRMLHKLSRAEQVLIAMYKLSRGTSCPCRYEDIVVKAFRSFPKHFQLRGYPHFPDATDVGKRLYGELKRAEFIRAANKMFSLTDKGIVKAEDLLRVVKSGENTQADRLTRDVVREVDRLRTTAAVRLFLARDSDKILDTDFYAYLGVTVRTDRNEFLGRMRAVSEAIKTAAKVEPLPLHIKLKELHNFLLGKFSEIIKYRKEDSK